MVDAFTFTEINYFVVSLICDFVQHFGSAICFVSSIATKAAMPSPTSFIIF